MNCCLAINRPLYSTICSLQSASRQRRLRRCRRHGRLPAAANSETPILSYSAILDSRDQFSHSTRYSISRFMLSWPSEFVLIVNIFSICDAIYRCCLDTMEPRTGKKFLFRKKNCFGSVGSDMWNNCVNCP